MSLRRNQKCEVFFACIWDIKIPCGDKFPFT
jgi:hypothetical protein